MRKIKNISILLVCIISIGYALSSIVAGNLYATLIRLSVIPVIFIPNLLEYIFKIKISNISKLIYTLFIIISHFLGSIINLYNIIPWWDTLAHTIFGFLWSFFILEFLIKNNNKKLWFNIIMILAIIALLAGLWEVFEFTSDQIFGKDAQNVLTTGIFDTMKDMIVAYLGSIFFCLMYAYEYLFNKELIIKKFINNFK